MDAALIILVVIVGLAVAGLAAYFSWKAQEARRLAMGALAASLGWTFDADGDGPPDRPFPQFDCFQRGHSRRAYNTLRGGRTIDGRPFPVQMGDYTYKVTTTNGKTTSTRTFRMSYAVIRVPWAVPDLLIREGMLDKLKGALGFDDIDFESEEFSRRFWVTCPDKKFAYDVIHPKMMEFLMAGDPPPLDLRGGCMCIVDGVRLWGTDEFAPRLSFVERFFTLWPEFLVSELERRA